MPKDFEQNGNAHTLTANHQDGERTFDLMVSWLVAQDRIEPSGQRFLLRANYPVAYDCTMHGPNDLWHQGLGQLATMVVSDRSETLLVRTWACSHGTSIVTVTTVVRAKQPLPVQQCGVLGASKDNSLGLLRLSFAAVSSAQARRPFRL